MVKSLATAALASSVDRFFARVALSRSKRSRDASRAESLDHRERILALEAIAARHETAPWTAPPDSFFGEAGEAGDWERTHVRAIGERGDVFDVRWQSGYQPLAADPEVLARMESRAENRWAHARLWLHRDGPRPTALLLHGYLGGSYAVEERAWPVRWMFDRLGLDLALPVLPHHGPRGAARRRPLFPSSDPRITIEGFRQAVWDLISLRRGLTERGAPAVGVMGMSLGGYTTALASTADPELAFAVPFIPLASIADIARDGGRLVGLPSQRREQHEALERAHAPVSPFTRPSQVDPTAALVIAGRADRITPVAHAKKLAAHLDAPLHVFDGGHLLQIGRDEGFREVARMLRRRGLLAPRR